jgi:hypothetical protein
MLAIGGVSDGFSVTTSAVNTAPTYTGETSYSEERGNCITVEQQATDSESDSISFAIEGGSWQLCQDNVTQVNKNVTVTDAYSASSITAITANFTACIAPTIWNGSSCSALDTTPNAFSFTDQTDVAINTAITSNTITVSGINSAAAISISGGSYSVNGGGYTSASGSVNNGDTVRVKVTSSGSGSTTTSAMLTIGGVSDGCSVTTGVVNQAPLLLTSTYNLNSGFDNIESFDISLVVSDDNSSLTDLSVIEVQGDARFTYSITGTNFKVERIDDYATPSEVIKVQFSDGEKSSATLIINLINFDDL